jgi:hypothetical protein
MTTQRTATAADVVEETTFDFHYRTKADGTPLIFKCRRLDMLTQLMEDVVNAPMMKAAAPIIQQINDFVAENTPGADMMMFSAFLQLQPDQKDTILEQLRRFACASIIEPKFVMGTPGHNEAPIQLLGADTLFALWNRHSLNDGAPRLSEVAAQTFRGAAIASADPAVSDGDQVRAAAVDVGPDAGAAREA